MFQTQRVTKTSKMAFRIMRLKRQARWSNRLQEIFMVSKRIFCQENYSNLLLKVFNWISWNYNEAKCHTSLFLGTFKTHTKSQLLVTTKQNQQRLMDDHWSCILIFGLNVNVWTSVEHSLRVLWALWGSIMMAMKGIGNGQTASILPHISVS